MTAADWDGLLLDLDGTLVDTEPIHCEVHREFLAQQGVRIDEAEIYTNIGAGDLAFYRGLMEAHGIAGDAQAWCEEKDRRMVERYRRGGLRVQPGVDCLLDHAASLGRPVCVVTSSRRDLAELVLGGAGLARRLPRRICWEDTEGHKPDPAPYLAGAEAIGIDPRRCLAVEDSAPGVRAAAAAGCRVVAVSHLVGADLLASAGAQRVLVDLADLVA